MQVKEGHPKGLYLCFSVEMWERFSFYGMRALFVLFMTKALLFSTQKAGSIYGLYLGFIYLAPLLGGYIADRYWGMNKAIIFGGFAMSLGQFLLAGIAFMNPEVVNARFIWLFYLSLVIMMVGCGFIKANISTAVGTLYERNDPRRDGAYTIFYMGINLGALLSPFVCGTLGEKVGWGWGFASAAFLMLIGVINYLMYNKKLLPDAVFHPASCTHKDGKKIVCDPLTLEEKHRIAAIFIMVFFVIFFWSAYEQAGSSLTWFADQSTARNISIFGWHWQVPTTWFQGINPIFVIILAPIFSSLWVKLAKKEIEPTTVHKFVWGLGLLAVSFVFMVFAVMAYEKNGPVSMLWLVGVYFIQTVAELCLSPIGLSLVTKLSPARFASFMMGVWFLGAFLGNLTAGLFAGSYDIMDHKTFFMIPIMTAGVAAVVLLLLAKPIKRWMHGIH